MTIRAKVHNGTLVPDCPLALPEGAEVEIVLRPAGSEEVPTLLDQLKHLAGSAPGLPADLAEQHDHYLYGRPKR